MRIAVCSECGCPIEVVDGEEWAYCPMCENDQVEIVNYKKQIKILEKALELACEWLNDYQYFDGDCPRYSDCWETENSKFWDCENCNCSKLAKDYFLSKAKEMKNE